MTFAFGDIFSIPRAKSAYFNTPSQAVQKKLKSTQHSKQKPSKIFFCLQKMAKLGATDKSGIWPYRLNATDYAPGL